MEHGEIIIKILKIIAGKKGKREKKLEILSVCDATFERKKYSTTSIKFETREI